MTTEPTTHRVATGYDFQTLAIWTDVSEGFRATAREVDRAVSHAFTLDPGEADLLLLLGRATEHRLKMSALARDMGFTSGGVTKVAGRLVARGLIERENDPDDRRVVYIVLTDDGRQVANDVCCLVSDVVQSRWNDVFGAAERASQLAESMSRLRTAPSVGGPQTRL